MESDLREFIQASIRSVWNLELLLCLWRTPSRAWAPDELVREMRASDLIVTEGLQTLTAVGLVSREASGTYHYSPASRDFDWLVAQLDRRYREHPSAVIKAIYSAPSDKLRTFADAFRFKKEP